MGIIKGRRGPAAGSGPSRAGAQQGMAGAQRCAPAPGEAATLPPMNDLAGKHIVLGLSGGVACYKSAELCRQLIKAGATVQVVMTTGAERFITATTMQALSGRAVHTSQWDTREANAMPHINLSREADAILINTCSVRDQAEQKALGKMGTMMHKGRDRKHVVYGFMGCMAQSRGEELFKTLPNLDVVVGTQKYHKVFEYVDTILQRRLEARMDDPQFSLRGTTVCDTAEEEGSQNTIRDHVPKAHEASAFVSIMQGCNMRCSFCIVPDTRGKERGRPISEIVGEVRHLAAHGVLADLAGDGDRLGLDVQFQPDDFAAVPSLFMPQQFDVCGGQT